MTGERGMAYPLVLNVSSPSGAISQGKAALPGTELNAVRQHMIDRNKASLLKKHTHFSKPSRYRSSVILCNKYIDLKHGKTCDYSVTDPGALAPNQSHLSQNMKPGRKREH